MPKIRMARTTITLPTDLLAEIDQNTENRSELIRKAVEEHLQHELHRKPTWAEITVAIKVLVKLAEEDAPYEPS